MRFCCWCSRQTFTPEQIEVKDKVIVVEPPLRPPPIIVQPIQSSTDDKKDDIKAQSNEPDNSQSQQDDVPNALPTEHDGPQTSEPEDSETDETTHIIRRPGIIPNFTTETETFTIHEKTAEEISIIKNAFAKNDFLNQILTGKKLDDVVNAMYKEDIGANEYIMKKGDSGDKMYVLHKGKLHFKGDGFEFEESKQHVFGELAILYKAGRLATVKAISKVELWVLKSSVYHQIMHRGVKEEHDERIEFLRKVPTLEDIKEEELHSGADVLETEFFKAGSAIVRQGDRGDKFYIIRAGSVTISKETEGEIGVLNQGQSFGELALQGEDCRKATITANPPGVECLTLTREHFELYFKNAKEVIVENQELDEKFKNMKLTDFKISNTLGIGAFGRVELVISKKNNNEVYALKYIKKQYVVEQNLQEHIYNEKYLQTPCRSLFIVRSYRTFKDAKYVYFLMEACLGGDLFALLHKQKNKRFEEKDAIFIAACVLEAFHYIHSRGIIFRDLKPENLMIDSNGYVKLTDFGYAKRLHGRNKTLTFAGTPEYVAPEILLNRGHDKGVDYWAYGILVYELLSGKTPFKTDDPSHMKTYNKILSGEYQSSPLIGNKARNLIEKLLRMLSKDRLGMQKRGIEDIRTHAWFFGFDWERLQAGKTPSPFKPKLSGPSDTRYFEKFPKDKNDTPNETSGWDDKF